MSSCFFSSRLKIRISLMSLSRKRRSTAFLKLPKAACDQQDFVLKYRHDSNNIVYSEISLSYFSNLEFFDLNSGTVRFISRIMSGISTFRDSVSSSSATPQASRSHTPEPWRYVSGRASSEACSPCSTEPPRKVSRPDAGPCIRSLMSFSGSKPARRSSAAPGARS